MSVNTAPAKHYIVRRQPVPLAVDQARITAADICAILADLTGLEWHMENRHVGGNGGVLFAETNGCPIQVPLCITGRGTAYLGKFDKKNFVERDYSATALLIDDDVLPLDLAYWLRGQERH